jgi:chemotaxis protein CheD
MTATTILGTCVAVCLFDTRLGVGGLNHFLLPRAPTAATAPGRFGDSATELLIAELSKLGANRRRLEAKVFGGTAGALEGVSLSRDLGARNLEAALAVLLAERIPVVSQNAGGRQSRKLLFSTGDGRAWVRFF